jgi:hypothetical protein
MATSLLVLFNCRLRRDTLVQNMSAKKIFMSIWEKVVE